MDTYLPKKKRQSVMQGLIYPAFLGTFIVSFTQQSGDYNSVPIFLLGVFLLGYNIILFIETDTTHAHRYGWSMFTADCVQIFLLCTIFHAIDFLKFTPPISVSDPHNPTFIFFLLTILIAVPGIWRLFATYNGMTKEPLLDSLAIAGASVTILTSLQLNF